MKDGDLRATFTIISSLASVQQGVNASTRDIVLWGLVITLIALFLGFLAIRTPIAGINSTAFSLSVAATDVASMSKEIASASEQLSSGATEQAAAIQETSASMEEIRAMVTKNSENAEQSAITAQGSQNTAENGKIIVQEMLQSIEQIDQSNTDIMLQIELSNRQISEIVKIISDIGNKTKVINEIVFQTKLLSFNASVEAARAGEHGKGFAVVAEEVGNLAKMSGTAAAEITQMLDVGIKKVESIVNDTKIKVEVLVKVGRGKVEAGSLIARRCAEVLTEILESVKSVSQLVSEISVASREQAKGVDEISKAVAQLDQVTQQNASASQISANTAGRLSGQVDVLRGSAASLTQALSGVNP